MYCATGSSQPSFFRRTNSCGLKEVSYVNRTTDVFVIGGGPAGLAAASPPAARVCRSPWPMGPAATHR